PLLGGPAREALRSARASGSSLDSSLPAPFSDNHEVAPRYTGRADFGGVADDLPAARDASAVMLAEALTGALTAPGVLAAGVAALGVAAVHVDVDAAESVAHRFDDFLEVIPGHPPATVGLIPFGAYALPEGFL